MLMYIVGSSCNCNDIPIGMLIHSMRIFVLCCFNSYIVVYSCIAQWNILLVLSLHLLFASVMENVHGRLKLVKMN